MTKVNISMSDDFLAEVDSLKKEEGLSRSELLRRSVRTYRELREQRKEEQKRKREIMEAVGIQDSLRAKSGKWDGVREIRKWRESRK